MGLSRTVSEIYGDFDRKSHSSYPIYLTTLNREFTFDFCNGIGIEKLKIMPPSDGEDEFDNICIPLDTIQECDRQTNGFAKNNIAVCMHRMLMHNSYCY